MVAPHRRGIKSDRHPGPGSRGRPRIDVTERRAPAADGARIERANAGVDGLVGQACGLAEPLELAHCAASHGRSANDDALASPTRAGPRPPVEAA